ncbi:tetratricopeptide repeat protein, partial [Klebsiella pneumoniae]
VTLERISRFTDAVARSDRVLAIDEKHAGALANRGNALLHLGQKAAAVENFERAVQLAPASLETLTNYARALHLHKQFAKAIETCDQVLSIDAEYGPAWLAKGLVHQHEHRSDEALASFDRALAIRADDLAASFQRGNALRTLRRHAEAIEAFD